jgi:ABC-2 type transport system permease protein
MSDSVYTSARTNTSELRPMARRRTVVEHLRELGSYRELLTNLTRKELTVRYQHSVLGFAWSMLQPVFLLVVYTIVFRILGAGFAKFSIWVLCGLLIWTFVSSSLLTATKSITENYSLVGKVKFPRAVLPLSSVASALVHLGLQSVAFAALLLIVRQPVDWEYMWLIPFAVITAMLVTTALALILAPLNAYARDTMHLLELLILGWFWATPILYQYELAAKFLGDNDLPRWLTLANPLTPVVITIQRAIYGSNMAEGLEPDPQLLPGYGPLWYLEALAITAAGALVLCWVALRMFDRAEVNLVEAL